MIVAVLVVGLYPPFIVCFYTIVSDSHLSPLLLFVFF